MEPDEIGVVLARASELHSKISDAIERALKSEFLLSTSGRSPNIRDKENFASSPTSDQGHGGKESQANRERRYSESDSYDRGSVAGDGSAEARSLGTIRDALEVLEEQLESLQTVQQQQRTEKDTALAELEESRRILLRRLKDHRGREWEIVHEALAFAGEPVDDRDDLPLPPYPMPLSDTSFSPTAEDQSSPQNGPTALKYNGAMKKLSLGHGQVENLDSDSNRGEADGSDRENQEEGTSFQVEPSEEGGGLLGLPLGFAKALYGLTRKAAIIAFSVGVAVAVSEARHRLEKRNSCTKFVPKRPASPPRPLPPQRECPPGKKLIMEDGYPKCVVKERVELPFPREIRTPDVLYGRG